MRLYECTLTFHDNLFYETRTMGRFYETGRLLHNIALSYALGLAATPFHHADDIPQYAVELAALNQAGVYVTPAGGIDVRFSINTFKFGDEQTSVFMEKLNRNLPTYGRAKEVAVGSSFRFAVMSETEIAFPRWIRMGLWMSKARLEVSDAIPLTHVEENTRRVIRRYPLNPADLPDEARLGLFDLVAMRPSNLVENAEITAAAWWRCTIGTATLDLPVGMRYRAADATTTAPIKKKRKGGDV
jgi:CRISPR-associated protein Csc1